jgi:hypothetical protein
MRKVPASPIGRVGSNIETKGDRYRYKALENIEIYVGKDILRYSKQGKD